MLIRYRELEACPPSEMICMESEYVSCRHADLSPDPITLDLALQQLSQEGTINYGLFPAILQQKSGASVLLMMCHLLLQL